MKAFSQPILQGSKGFRGQTGRLYNTFEHMLKTSLLILRFSGKLYVSVSDLRSSYSLSEEGR